MTTPIYLISALLIALAAGVAFSHVLEVAGKRRLAAATAIGLHQTLYTGHRAPMALIEIGAGVALLGATILAAGQGAEFWLTGAALAGTWATTVIFFAVTDRGNRRISRWDPRKPPGDWQQTSARWAASHGARAALFLLSLGLLAAAMLAH